MIDISIIEANYSQMADGQLLELANTEGHELLPEALDALKKEFLKRGLDMNVFNAVEETKQVHKEAMVQKVKDTISTDFMSSIWAYVFEAKKENLADDEIKKGLMEKGLDDEQTSLIMQSVTHKVKESIKIYESETLTGGLICGVGLVITFVTYSAAINGGTYFIAWGAIIFGAVRLFKGMANRDRFKTILSNIELHPE